MKKIKFLIISLIFIILIIIGTLIFLQLREDGDKELEEHYDEESEYVEETPDLVYDKLDTVNDNDTYYTITNCVNNFLSSLQQGDITVILNLLDNKYCNDNKINESNISDFIKTISYYQQFYTYEIYQENEELQITRFYLYGKTLVDSEKSIESCYIVRVDYDNFTYSIIPFYGNNNESITVENVRKITENYNNKIEENNNNTFHFKQSSNEYIAREYFSNLKYLLINDYEKLYDILDEEYKNKKYSNVEEFKNYIKNNTDHIEMTVLSKYKVNDEDGNIEIVCLDNYQNYYIFNVKSVMKYTIQLDNYTVETNEYKEAYSKASDEQKLFTNIGKFINMINNKDYQYAYKLLNEDFRSSNFGTLDEFKKYMQNNFFDYNVISSTADVSSEGQYYICSVTIRSGESSVASEMNKKFIILFGEGTEFSMSFDIN